MTLSKAWNSAFQALFTHALDSMLLANDTARYVEVNPAACALTGYSRSALLHRRVWDLTPEPDQARGQALWQQFLARGTQQGEYTLHRQDGTLVDVEYRAVAHIVPGLHLSVLHDITARKQAEAALQHLQATLAQRVEERTVALHQEMAQRQRLEQEAQRAAHFALLGRLAAGMAHEIRNPLGAVFLYVDLLEEEMHQPSPDSAEMLPQTFREIKTQLAQLSDLVEDYLSLVRVSHSALTPQELGTIVQDWAGEWARLAAARDVTFCCEGLETVGRVAVHRSTLRRALLNLVHNALEAMPQGGTLTLRGHRQATTVLLDLRDTGRGIPPEHTTRIFEPLYTTKPGGTGLGLYIVQEVVAAHGGQVTVQSAVGHGSIFTITLPLLASRDTS
jgi:PAS domain S-box-containing protein